MEFRPLKSKVNAISEEECLQLLREEKRGVLSVLGDGGYPYATPMNHYYHDEDGFLYFHCGRSGHRIDALEHDDRVSFCCYSAAPPADGGWAMRVKSVVAFGRMEVIDDRGLVCDIAARMCRKFTDDESFIEREIERSADATLLMRFRIEHISGKQVTED